MSKKRVPNGSSTLHFYINIHIYIHFHILFDLFTYFDCVEIEKHWKI